jgi:hypothetical protein
MCKRLSEIYCWLNWGNFCYWHPYYCCSSHRQFTDVSTTMLFSFFQSTKIKPIYIYIYIKQTFWKASVYCIKPSVKLTSPLPYYFIKKMLIKKTRIILLLTRITSFHVYVLQRYDICMVRCDVQREWHVTRSALSWRIVLSRCDVITVEVVLKVISVGTPAIRHIHVNIW